MPPPRPPKRSPKRSTCTPMLFHRATFRGFARTSRSRNCCFPSNRAVPSQGTSQFPWLRSSRDWPLKNFSLFPVRDFMRLLALPSYATRSGILPANSISSRDGLLAMIKIPRSLSLATRELAIITLPPSCFFESICLRNRNADLGIFVGE